MKKSKPLYIEIAAGLGTGKTTLANLLGNNGLCSEIEDHDENPFIYKFYNDPVTHAFETEITFLMQHYHSIREALNTSEKQAHPAIVFDFSPLLDLAYANVTLQPHQKTAFEALFHSIKIELPQPDLLIHIDCDPNEQFARIQKRGRPFEQNIPLSYLQDIRTTLKNVINNTSDYSKKCLYLDTTHIDPTTKIGRDKLLNEVYKAANLNTSSPKTSQQAPPFSNGFQP